MVGHCRMAQVARFAAALGFSYVAAASELTEVLSVKTPVTVSSTPSGTSYITSSHILSRTGRFAVFFSQANDVIANQDNRLPTHIFVRDRQSGTTTQMTVSPTAVYIDQPSISDDGRYVAFVGYGDVLGNGETTFTPRVYVMDLQTHAIEKITVGTGNSLPNGDSSNPMISGNGRYVVFASQASNLVSGDTNGLSDIFETDRSSHTTKRVSFNVSGKQLNGPAQLPFVSGDGRYVVYESSASNAATVAGYIPNAILLYDRNTGKTELASQNAKGVPANIGGGETGSVSDDGRYVAFTSQASNLVPGTEATWKQVFVRDRLTHVVICVSCSSAGAVGNYNSYGPIINGGGTFVAFQSQSNNLISNDTNEFGSTDVFVHDLKTGATTRANLATDGTEALGQGLEPRGISLSGDGKWVAFHTDASNLVANDLNNTTDVFVHEIRPRTLIRVNTGGAAYTDSLGRTWQADRGFNTGVSSRSTAKIANTAEPALYQDQRYDAPGGPELRYEFAVPNGTYLVRLHFAENYEPNFKAGKRQFDIDLEGVRRYSNLDIFAAAGGHAALILESAVTVVDGKLDIDFHHEIENPQVNAIEIIEQ